MRQCSAVGNSAIAFTELCKHVCWYLIQAKILIRPTIQHRFQLHLIWPLILIAVQGLSSTNLSEFQTCYVPKICLRDSKEKCPENILEWFVWIRMAKMAQQVQVRIFGSVTTSVELKRLISGQWTLELFAIPGAHLVKQTHPWQDSVKRD